MWIGVHGVSGYSQGCSGAAGGDLLCSYVHGWPPDITDARLFILLNPGCARCNSCNTSCRHCGGITTLAPHKTQPPCTLDSSLLQWYGAMFMSIFPPGQPRIRYSLTCASVGSRPVQRLIWTALICEESSSSINKTRSSGSYFTVTGSGNLPRQSALPWLLPALQWVLYSYPRKVIARRCTRGDAVTVTCLSSPNSDTSGLWSVIWSQSNVEFKCKPYCGSLLAELRIISSCSVVSLTKIQWDARGSSDRSSFAFWKLRCCGGPHNHFCPLLSNVCNGANMFDKLYRNRL